MGRVCPTLPSTPIRRRLASRPCRRRLRDPINRRHLEVRKVRVISETKNKGKLGPARPIAKACQIPRPIRKSSPTAPSINRSKETPIERRRLASRGRSRWRHEVVYGRMGCRHPHDQDGVAAGMLQHAERSKISAALSVRIPLSPASAGFLLDIDHGQHRRQRRTERAVGAHRHAGEPDSDTWRIIGAIIVLSLFVVALLWLVSGLSS